MTRSSILALIMATCMTTPAFAETPLEWFVDLKRLAKDGRITAHMGGYGSDMKLLIVRANGLTARVSDWSPLPSSAAAKTVCLGAVRRLEIALNARPAAAIEAAVQANGRDLDTCLAEIQRR